MVGWVGDGSQCGNVAVSDYFLRFVIFLGIMKSRPKTQDSVLVRESDTMRERLNSLRGSADGGGLSWREIARLEEFAPCPAGTLCAFAKGAEMPRKWRARFGLPDERLAVVCPRHEIVHLWDCETQVVKPTPKPRRKREPRNQPGKIWMY